MTTTTNNNSKTSPPSPLGKDTNENSPKKEATETDASKLEQNFFFGLTIDDALQSSENLHDLFYNACKYNHLELVKRCVEEKHVNVNEPFNNDYALCVAR